MENIFNYISARNKDSSYIRPGSDRMIDLYDAARGHYNSNICSCKFTQNEVTLAALELKLEKPRLYIFRKKILDKCSITVIFGSH